MVLEKWENDEGYSITWKELEKILDIVFPDKKISDKWYQKWTCSDWKKGKYDRTYINLRQYKLGVMGSKLKSETSLGFYDNVNNRYIISDKHKKVIDVIKEYEKEK